jgi:phosphoglycolate phosphatase-like HAD superfamily hydrolase
MPPVHRLILFDFDGVLGDTLDDLLAFAKEACQEIGLSCHPAPADLDALDPMSIPQYGRRLGVPEEQVGHFTRLVLDRFRSKRKPPRLFDGMRDVLDRLSANSALAIVTGNTSSLVEMFLRVHGLQTHFARVVGAEIPGTRAEKIRALIDDLGASNETACLVGDSISDVRAAREAGITSVAVTWGHQTEARLESAEPDVIVRSPQELLKALA